jgi:hypothetical protein
MKKIYSNEVTVMYGFSWKRIGFGFSIDQTAFTFDFLIFWLAVEW